MRNSKINNLNRYPQPVNGHGSLRDIQVLVNRYPSVFTRSIKDKLTIKSNKIEWVSPLQEDDFAEYRDIGFIKRLGINSLKVPLNDFWPQKGPQWDALGIGDKEEVFIVEAKANIPEIVSPRSGAKGKSLQLIQKSLQETKTYLKVGNKIDWSGSFYQYTNRVTHLYFLRVLNKIPVFLIFVYFINDKSVDGPETIKEWIAALTVMKRYLGLSNHKLSKHMADIFIDVRNLGL